MTSVSFDSSINNIYNNSAVLVLGGNLPSKKCIEIHINLSHEFVAADSGIIKLLKKNLIPKYVIGDLDSIVGNESKLIEKKIILVKFKSNFTNDFEKTLNWLKKRNYKMITLFGVSGGDSDHTLNNFSIISKYSSSLKFEIIENNYDVVILNSKNQNVLVREMIVGKRISLIPLSKAKVTTKGLRWNLKNELLEIGKREGASNYNLNKRIQIDVSYGCLAVYIFK